MYDIKRIGKIIADIQKYLAELKRYNIQNSSDLNESMKYHATAMLLFALLDRIIDLGTEAVIAEDLGMPQTHRDIMPLLAKANVLNKEHAEKINTLIKERNKIAHLYEEITPKQLFSIVNALPIIEQFLTTIKKRIRQKEEHEEDTS